MREYCGIGGGGGGGREGWGGGGWSDTAGTENQTPNCKTTASVIVFHVRFFYL